MVSTFIWAVLVFGFTHEYLSNLRKDRLKCVTTFRHLVWRSVKYCDEYGGWVLSITLTRQSFTPIHKQTHS